MAAAPVIQVTGSTSGATLDGIDKFDLVEGEILTFVDVAPENAVAAYEWFIDEAALDSSVTLVNPETASPTMVVPADADAESGTIAIRASVNGGEFETTIRVALRMPNTDARPPLWEEEIESNADGNTRGWHRSQTDWMRAANRRLPYILTADPSAGGLAAPIGSVGRRDNGGAGELWQKVGAADTAWSRVERGAVAQKFTSLISIAAREGHASDTYLVAGQDQFNAADHALAGTALTLKFQAVASNGAAALTTHAQLYNLTDGEVIATLDFTSESATSAEAALVIGAGAGEIDLSAKIYEVRIWVDAPVDETSTIELGSAHIRVENTVQ